VLFQTSIFTLVFLPFALAVYYACVNRPALRQIALIVASLMFYAWWDIRFVPLLLGQVIATWCLAQISNRGRRRLLLVAGIFLNLASIATFKYLDFLLVSIESAIGISLPRAGLVLPIGISFFSFQLISYLVDLYRQQAPLYPIRQFTLFVVVFPHLIAGPIVRHNELIPQFDMNPLRDGLERRFATGIILFALGFAKKVFVADPLARISDPLFAKAAQAALSFGEAWTAALAFSFQLFLDFSAYTEMAIGIALMFGLTLPENFRRPYASTSLREFWRRWHISLSNFIRDYLYLPLGGSRAGPTRYVFATLVAMGLCGLWHGAGWTFVAWGLWHGGGLIACRIWQKTARPMPAIAAWALTMLFVLLGWVLFRARSFSDALSIISSLFGGNGFSGEVQGLRLMVVAAVFAIAVPSAHELKEKWLQDWWPIAFATAGLAAAAFVEVGLSEAISFIYFQF
jgi:alginate O-acetyltransferase complex protein AlgI